MSSRARRKDQDRAPRDPLEPEASPEATPEAAEPIEILEVVGVDETTGTVRKEPGRVAAEPPTASLDAETDSLRRELEEANREKDKNHDLLLRAQAEFDNFRKRIDRERDEVRSFAAAQVLRNLLPVLDNLERALRTSEGSDDPLRQGLVLVHQQLLETLKKEGLQVMDTLGTAFDPRQHEAVEVLDVEGFEEGIILEEAQKGYLLNGRLLRPAMVKVASGRQPKGEGPGPQS